MDDHAYPDSNGNEDLKKDLIFDSAEREDMNISIGPYSDRSEVFPNFKGSKNLQMDNAKESKDMDKGWAWLVAFASAITVFLASSIIYCGGVYNVEFLEEFQESKTVTAWVSGIPSALGSLGGPLGSVVSNRFSIRTSVIAGGFLMSIGLFCSSFIYNINLMMLFFGVTTGLGLALLYTPTIAVTGFYFDKKLNLANNLIGAAASIGILVFPFTIHALIDWCGWRGSVVVLSGLVLNIIPCALIMKPTKFSKESTSKIFDLKLFLNGKLLLFHMYCFIFGMAMSVVYIHLPEFALHNGTSEFEASLLISFIGIAGLVAKLAIASIALRIKVKPVAVCAIASLICGLTTFLLPFVGSSLAAQIVYGTIFGMTSAPTYTFIPALTLMCVDRASLTTSMRISMLVNGVGLLIGPPVAGTFFDMSGSYQGSFLFSGIAWWLSALLLLIPTICSKLVRSPIKFTSKHARKDYI